MLCVISFEGLSDPRLLGEVGDLGLSIHLDQLFLRALRKRERVSKPAKLRIRGASPLRTQRVCVLCGLFLNPPKLMTRSTTSSCQKFLGM